MSNTTNKTCVDLFSNRLTDVVVGQPLQQTGLVVPGWRPDAGRQQAEVRLVNVQSEIRSGAQFDVRASLLVL